MKRITLFCGHYGSGKTNVAINYAKLVKTEYDSVALADLDIVNPYFRSKDSKEELEALGIKLICSEYANSNVDIPALPDEMYAVTDNRDTRYILDIGGDDRGALALGRLAPSILSENDYECLAVVNMYRPLTRDAESALEVLAEIEYAGKINFTGIVNCSNLGRETTEAAVLKSVPYAEEIARRKNIPVVFTAVEQGLYKGLCGKLENPFSMELQKKII